MMSRPNHWEARRNWSMEPLSRAEPSPTCEPAPTIPYPVADKLWEATAADEAIQGRATPIVSRPRNYGAACFATRLHQQLEHGNGRGFASSLPRTQVQRL